jgi:broad specificity phosphatase PhoE
MEVFMTRLILIRHAQSDYTLENRYCGFSDPPLNNIGRWQSKRMAAYLKNVSVNMVYSSDLRRAYETAKIVFKNGSIEKLTDLREMNFGIFEGLKYEEIIEKYPKRYKDWTDNPIKVKIPEGETLESLSKRVREGLSLILSQHKDSEIALVTHGGPIRIILCDALRYDLEMFWQIEQEVCALNILYYSKKSLPSVVKINDVSHL